MAPADSPTLILAYNADSGLAQAITDSFVKTFFPDRYSCDLCQITHSALGARKEWKAFAERFAGTIELLHRDEYDGAEALPAIFVRRGEEEPRVLLSAAELAEIAGVERLTEQIEARLSDQGPV